MRKRHTTVLPSDSSKMSFYFLIEANSPTHTHTHLFFSLQSYRTADEAKNDHMFHMSTLSLPEDYKGVF